MSNTAEAIVETAGDQPQEVYACLEIFGHRVHYGRILEVEQFGAKMLRIDVPKDGDFEKGYVSHFYGGASIFSLTYCDKATVEAKNRPYRYQALPYRSRPDEDDEVDPETGEILDDESEADEADQNLAMEADPGM